MSEWWKLYLKVTFKPDHGFEACPECGFTRYVYVGEEVGVFESPEEAGILEDLPLGRSREIEGCPLCNRSITLVSTADIRDYQRRAR